MGGEILSDWWVKPKGDELAPWRPQFEKPTTRESEGVRDLFPDPGEEIVWNPYPIPLPGLDGSPPPKATPRVNLLQVVWREGTLPDLILGREGISAELYKLPFEEREAAVPEELRGALLQGHLSRDFPPSVFMHGTKDTLILMEESVNPWEKLRKAGARTELVTVEGAAHALLDPKNIPHLVKGAEEAQTRAWEFIKEELLRK